VPINSIDQFLDDDDDDDDDDVFLTVKAAVTATLK
jgi:hypothetical protein